MQLSLATAPVTDPVTLAEARRWLNFTAGITEDDAVLEDLIRESYDFLEEWTNRRMLGQTWTLTLDASEVSDTIRVPLVPLRSVSSIVTTDDDGTATTVSATYYSVRAGENPRITLTDIGEWPTDMREYNSMAITCVCGYGLSTIPMAGFVPASTTAPGLNDLSAAGTFTGTARTTFELKIDSIATPDTFKWRKYTADRYGQKTYGSWTTGVAITGSAQTLADGVTATFAATTGHTLNDAWTIQLNERLPDRVRLALKALIIYFYTTKGRGVTETVSGQLIGLPNSVRDLMDSLRVAAV
jgi:uncharacterized phiE125 gp8 family phage protein